MWKRNLRQCIVKCVENVSIKTEETWNVCKKKANNFNWSKIATFQTYFTKLKIEIKNQFSSSPILLNNPQGSQPLHSLTDNDYIYIFCGVPSIKYLIMYLHNSGVSNFNGALV